MEIHVLGLSNRRGRRSNVCRSDGGAFKVGVEEVGVSGLKKTGKGGDGTNVVHMLEL